MLAIALQMPGRELLFEIWYLTWLKQRCVDVPRHRELGPYHSRLCRILGLLAHFSATFM